MNSTKFMPQRLSDDIRVSIVTPSYNQGKYLEETLLSVLSQDYPNIEYLVIDGRSSDESIEIIKRYAKRLDYWISERDNGQSHAINKGWQRATGEIVAWLNADDVLLPGAVLKAVDSFKLNPTAAVVHGDSIVVSADGLQIGHVGSKFDLKSSVNGCNNTISQPSAFIRREYLDEVGLLDEKLHCAMDYDLWLRLALIGPIIHIQQDWSKFRVHQNSKTSKMNLRGDCLQIMEKFFSAANVPAHISALRRRSLSWACLFLGKADRQMGKKKKAVLLALRALILSPGLCLGEARDIFIECIVDDRAFQRLRSLHRWFMGL